MLVGIDPDHVDFSDPALPPGMDAAGIRRGIAVSLESLRTAGHQPEHMYISDDPSSASEQVYDRLSTDRVDCLVIGGGVRLPPRNLVLFEAILNAVARVTQSPAIALVARPDDTPAAVQRVLA